MKQFKIYIFQLVEEKESKGESDLEELYGEKCHRGSDSSGTSSEDDGEF